MMMGAVGRRRDRFLALKMKQALTDTGIAVSLAGELDGHVVGFLLARLYYGEFGVTEPAAVLDVFDQEPLPPDNPLWTEPRAWVTPHVAAPSEIDPIADEFAANYQRFINGEPLQHEVDRDRGY